MLLETREHGSLRAQGWSRRDCHPIVPLGRAPIDREDPKSEIFHEHGAGNDHDGASATTIAATGAANTARRKIVVRVDDLKPRTYYSFRASAVNTRGAGEPGAPSRRIRTPTAPSLSSGNATSGISGGRQGGATGADVD